eukprot:6683780-Prymnesium_polylepis.1
MYRSKTVNRRSNLYPVKHYPPVSTTCRRTHDIDKSANRPSRPSPVTLDPIVPPQPTLLNVRRPLGVAVGQRPAKLLRDPLLTREHGEALVLGAMIADVTDAALPRAASGDEAGK